MNCNIGSTFNGGSLQIEQNWLRLDIKIAVESCYKHTLQLSRGNICVANFIPPVNGGCLDNYLDQKCDFILKHCISSKSRLDPAVVAW